MVEPEKEVGEGVDQGAQFGIGLEQFLGAETIARFRELKERCDPDGLLETDLATLYEITSSGERSFTNIYEPDF